MSTLTKVSRFCAIRISNILSLLRYRFMSYAQDSERESIASENKSLVRDWLFRIKYNHREAARCVVSSIEHFKDKRDIQHEWLLVNYRNLETNMDGVLCIDRSAPTSNSSSASVTDTSSIVSSSAESSLDSSRVRAMDRVKKVDRERDRELFDGTPMILTFSSPPRPNLIDIAFLAVAVSRSRGYYAVLTYNCYWFAKTFLEALKELFPGSIETPTVTNLGHFHSIPTLIRDSTPEAIRLYGLYQASFWARINQEAAANNARVIAQEVAEQEREARENAERQAVKEREARKKEREARKNAEIQAVKEREARKNAEIQAVKEREARENAEIQAVKEREARKNAQRELEQMKEELLRLQQTAGTM